MFKIIKAGPWKVLLVLHKNQGIQLTKYKVAKMTDYSYENVLAILSGLEEDGLVIINKKTRHARHGNFVSLSEKGKLLVDFLRKMTDE